MRTNSDLLKKFGNQVANLKGWEVVPLESVLKLITYGLTVRPKYHPQGIPLVSATQIRNGVVDLDSAPRISVDDYEKLSDKCKARPGDILFAKTGTIGHCAICHSEEKVALAQNVARLVFDETQIEAKFALRYLRTPFIQDLAKRSAKGNAVQDLQLGEIRKFPIPIPPLEEQRRIAAILDKADAIRRKRKEAIALTEELLRSAFLEMFGDPITNPKGWEIVTFGELVPEKGQIVDGPFGSSLKPECYVSSGIRVVRNFNIHDDFFDQSSFVYVTKEKFAEICRSNVHPGDLLLSTKGTIGDICIMPDLQGESVLSASGTVRIRIPKNSPLLPEVIVHQMLQRSYKQYMKGIEAGSNQKYLNLSGIRKMELMVPPIDLQREFTLIRKNTLKLKFNQETVFSESNSFFNSLLQRAFRGEL